MGPESSAGPLGPALPASFGRYTLLERVGGGGMATVYRASLSGDRGFEKDVAVKVIRQELSEESQFTDMFLDEARLSARLTHANIVQTFDFGQHEGVHFLAMELVRGRTLAATLRICNAKGIRLGLAPSLHIAAELARGLSYAHRLAGPGGEALGIVHRDVSPQNVLISREGEVKLADFGIAKAVNRSHVTQPGRVRGKCAYMAPEQIRGEALDGRADVFALGIVLWECLTCRPLFDGDSDAAVLMQVLEKDLERPSHFAPEVPPAVDDLVLRLLSRSRHDRPDATQAARELADLTLRLIRSQADIDLAELQRRLGSGTAVYRPPDPLSQVQVAEATAERTTVPHGSPPVPNLMPGAARPAAAAPSRPDDAAAPASGLDPHAPTLEHRARGAPAGPTPPPAPRRSPRGWLAGAAIAVLAMAGVGGFVFRGVGTAEARSGDTLVPARPDSVAGSIEDTDVPARPDSVAGPLADTDAHPEAERSLVAQADELASAHGVAEPELPGESATQVAAPRIEPAAPLERPSAPRAAKPAPAAVHKQGQLVLATRLPGRTSVQIGRKSIDLGASPTSVPLNAGTHRLRILRDGSGACTATVRIEPDRKHTLLVEAGAVSELAGTKRTPLPCN